MGIDAQAEPTAPLARRRVLGADTMGRYLFRRAWHAFFVLVGVILLVFFIGHAVGDPVLLMLPPGLPRARYLELERALGLDAPLYLQFTRALGGWVQGDFGDSLWQRAPAFPLAMHRLPATLYLTGSAIVLALPLSFAIGVASALSPRSILDRALNAFSVCCISLPDFWLALMLIIFFAVQLRWLPTSGYGGLSHVILPAITLALPIAGRIGQVLRSSLLEEMQKLFVTTARSRGLSQRQVIMRHAMRSAMLPTVTLSAVEAVSLLNGAIVVETIFAWPGLGRLLIEAIVQRDLPLVEAAVVVITLAVILLNLLVDLTYSYLDPRIRRPSVSG